MALKKLSDEKYGALSAEYYQFTKKVGGDYPDVEYYLQALKPIKGPILEVGAGTGRLLIPLLKAGHKIEALEPSPHMIEWLKKNLKAAKATCPIHQALAEEFIKADFFSAIILSFGSFQLFSPPALAKKVLQNIYKNLSPGGKLFIDIDTLYPEPQFANQWIEGGEIKASGASKISIGGKRSWDLKKQLEKIELLYQRIKSGKKLESETQHFSLRSYKPLEMKELLESIGFKKISFWLDHRRDTQSQKIENVSTICYQAEKGR